MILKKLSYPLIQYFDFTLKRVYCIDNLYALSTHLLFCRPISPLKNDKFVCLFACITCYLLKKTTYSIQIIEESELSDCNTNR